MTVFGYSLLDVKAGVYSSPFFMIHDQMAMRAVAELGKDGSTTPGKYPSDFVLYCVCMFNDNTGEIVSVDLRSLGSVSALVAQLG